MTIADLLDSVISVKTLLVAILVYGLAPGFVLRLVVLLYRRNDPRRAELIAELYGVPRLMRPFWVAEQIETAVFDGLVPRLRSVRWPRLRALHRRRRAEAVPPQVSAVDSLGRLTGLFGGTGIGKSHAMTEIIQDTVALSESDATINTEPIRPVGQIVFDVNGEYANINHQGTSNAIHEQLPQDVIRYSVLEKPSFRVLAPNVHQSIPEVIDLLRAGKIVIIDLSQGSPGIQKSYANCISEAIYSDAMKHFMHGRQPNFIQMYIEEAHNLFRRTEDPTDIYNRLAKESQKLRIGLCYTTQEDRAISRTVLHNTYRWIAFRRDNRN